jgi:hypothetical protein
MVERGGEASSSAAMTTAMMTDGMSKIRINSKLGLVA